MAENKIIGYKKIFGFVLPDWVNEEMLRTVVVGLLSSVVMLLVLIFVVWPNFGTVRTKNAVLNANKRDLEALKSSGQGLERIKTDLSTADQDRVLSAMPTEYSPDSAIYLLRSVSADTGVSIVSYSLPSGTLLNSAPTIGTNAGGDMVSFVAYPIRLTVAAPVNSLLSFITKIESSLPFGVVSDLNLQEVTKLSRSTADNTVQLVMEIKFYQSILGRININKLQTLTAENLSLAKELTGYNLLTVPEVPGQDLSIPAATGSGSLFGF